MSFVNGLLFNRLHTSHPSMPGISTSSTIASNDSDAAIFNASRPRVAVTTVAVGSSISA